jgi:hypothetical protein
MTLARRKHDVRQKTCMACKVIVQHVASIVVSAMYVANLVHLVVVAVHTAPTTLCFADASVAVCARKALSALELLGQVIHIEAGALQDLRI